MTASGASGGGAGACGKGATGQGAGLRERRLYFPRMTDCGVEAFAAVFRSVGIDAVMVPPSDARTLELGARYLAGEECLPAKLTLGDFLKVAEAPGFDPGRTAFMMATAGGPCRFGQYVPHLRKIFRELGYPEVLIVSMASEEGYQDIGSLGADFTRAAWHAVVASDLLRKLVLKTRPYECCPGDTDAAYTCCLRELCTALESREASSRDHLEVLVAALTWIRDRFRAIPARYRVGRLLIGIVGEIFCRLNDFSNDHLIRRLEACGGEAWLSDVSEWVWYCNDDQERLLRLTRRGFSLAMLGAKLRDHVQHADEAALRAPFAEDFAGYEEPEDLDEILRAADRYLPRAGSSGEMVLSAGKVEYLFRKGADGIIDISPFTCMNGIVSEALYPRQSQDHAGIPIKNFYFDGTGEDMTDDLEIFLELARTYQRRKPHPRRYPPWFG
jgi:predicted nucleotide-binding protein (sugar kinase/HSP70/actin superfamily)